MRNKAMPALLCALLILSPPVALALDVGSSGAQSLVDCDELGRGAREAQTRYVQINTPRTDPVKVFDDATGACLDFIMMFDIGFSLTIPSIGDLDALLRSMATKLLQRACQAATAQFNKAVGDALASVNAPLGTLNSIPGVNIGVSAGSGSGAGVNLNTSVQSDGGSTVRRAADNAVNRVVGLIK